MHMHVLPRWKLSTQEHTVHYLPFPALSLSLISEKGGNMAMDACRLRYVGLFIGNP
jgi:hypothetical protein